MKMEENKVVVFTKRPGTNGTPTVDCFSTESYPEPVESDLTEGQCVVSTLYLSVDPALRCMMNESTGVDYISPWELNRPIKGLGGVGEVIFTSSNCQLSIGDLVTSTDMFWPWTKRFVSDDKAMRKVNLPSGQGPSIILSCLGLIGLTSLLGIRKKGRIDPKKKQTLVVSGAAGACGSLAGQIGRLEGCQQVVGICGSDDKCAMIVNELGFDGAVNYKTADVAERLKVLCPNGIDVYFDNVGGQISDIVISQMNNDGSIILCGQIAVYNEDLPYPPPISQETQDILNQRNIQRDRFTVVNYPDDYADGLLLLGKWLQDGSLRVMETVLDGIENTGQAFVDMMSGRNTGKQLVKVADRTMEIVNARATLLTNREVLSLLEEVRNSERQKAKANRLHKLSTIVYETTRYLERTPAATQDSECITKFLTAVKKYKLTPAESLMMVNLRPTTPVEVQLIIEECEERLTEAQVDELAQLVVQCLPLPPGDVDAQQTAAAAPSAASGGE